MTVRLADGPDIPPHRHVQMPSGWLRVLELKARARLQVGACAAIKVPAGRKREGMKAKLSVGQSAVRKTKRALRDLYLEGSL